MATIIACRDLEEVLNKEIGAKKELIVVEKLAGATPEAAVAFSRLCPNVKYRAFNFTNLSERYFKRAKELCESLGIDFALFGANTKYIAGMNLYKIKLTEMFDCGTVDAIIYWGKALKHFESFKNDEEESLKIFEQEKYQYGEDFARHHEVIRQQRGGVSKIDSSELRAILADDISCLKEDGRLITNFVNDFEKIHLLMADLGMKHVNYRFIYPKDFKGDERIITVWRSIGARNRQK